MMQMTANRKSKTSMSDLWVMYQGGSTYVMGGIIARTRSWNDF